MFLKKKKKKILLHKLSINYERSYLHKRVCLSYNIRRRKKYTSFIFYRLKKKIAIKFSLKFVHYTLFLKIYYIYLSHLFYSTLKYKNTRTICSTRDKLKKEYDKALLGRSQLGPIRFRGSSFRGKKLVRWCNRPLCPLVFELHEDRASHEW